MSLKGNGRFDYLRDFIIIAVTILTLVLLPIWAAMD